MMGEWNRFMINSGIEVFNSLFLFNVLYFRFEVDIFVFVFFLVLFVFVIVIGNLIVMIVFIYNWKLWKRGNVFLVSLVCFDCIVGVVFLLFWICILGFGISKGEVFYEFFISLDIFSVLILVFYLIVISVECFIFVLRLFLY